MTLHLIKLSVGSENVASLRRWQASRRKLKPKKGVPPPPWHVTRMIPKRREALLDGGSIYWVIDGMVRARQTLKDIHPFMDTDGLRRCYLVFSPRLVATEPRPHRPFQGWRYLDPADAPADLAGGTLTTLPESMRAELAGLGLL